MSTHHPGSTSSCSPFSWQHCHFTVDLALKVLRVCLLVTTEELWEASGRRWGGSLSIITQKHTTKSESKHHSTCRLPIVFINAGSSPNRWLLLKWERNIAFLKWKEWKAKIIVICLESAGFLSFSCWKFGMQRGANHPPDIFKCSVLQHSEDWIRWDCRCLDINPKKKKGATCENATAIYSWLCRHWFWSC